MVLAAKYESWSLPLAVIIVVPMCSVRGSWACGCGWRSHFQADRLRGAGGTCAKQDAIPDRGVRQSKRQETGMARGTPREASRLRLRTILMTSLRVHPGGRLRWGSQPGAGAARDAPGPWPAVFSGMLGVTLFGIF